jgi:hypothetical protein
MATARGCRMWSSRTRPDSLRDWGTEVVFNVVDPTRRGVGKRAANDRPIAPRSSVSRTITERRRRFVVDRLLDALSNDGVSALQHSAASASSQRGLQLGRSAKTTRRVVLHSHDIRVAGHFSAYGMPERTIGSCDGRGTGLRGGAGVSRCAGMDILSRMLCSTASNLLLKSRVVDSWLAANWSTLRLICS